MAYEWDVKAWLMADRAAVHGEIALKLSRRDHNDSYLVQPAEQMSRALRKDADALFRDLLWRIAHIPRSG